MCLGSDHVFVCLGFMERGSGHVFVFLGSDHVFVCLGSGHVFK